MKILMTLETSFPPDKRVENEIDSLLSKGYEVHIICTGKTKQSLKEDHYKEAKVHRIFPNFFIRKSSVAALKVPLYFMYWKRKLQKILKKHSFNVVHIHDLPLLKPVYELKKQYGFKIVLDLHENWPALLNISPHTKSIPGRLLCSIPQWKDYEKKYLPVADKIIVVVEEAKQRIQSLSIDLPDIYVVSNTINLNDLLPERKNRNNNKDKTIFVYEGGITYHRGLQNVIKAFAKIGDPRKNAELWIIGDGSYLKTLKRLSGSLNLNDTVKFFGWQPQTKVYELLEQSDIAIIPHIKSQHTDTTIPHKLFHYMYAELPVLASNCKPIERIIKETSSGYIYKHDDIYNLAEQILLLLNMNHSSHKNQSKKWVMKKYNWQHEAKILDEVYKNLYS